MPEGIETRHRTGCPAGLTAELRGKCECQPHYRAVVRGRGGAKRTKTFHRLADARAWRAHALSDVVRVPRLAPRAPSLTLAADALLDDMRAGSARTRSGDPYKPRVIRDFEAAFERHLKPELGSLRLDEVTTADVQRLADGLLSSGSAPSTVRNAIVPLRVLYRRAVRNGTVPASPCEHVELPAVRGRRDRIVSPAEAELLLAALAPRDRALWGCAFYAGLRLGEIQALRWQDVDLGAGLIHVSHGWDRVEGLIAPKSRAGVRRVIITAGLRDLLAELAASGEREPASFVFGSTPAHAFTESAVRNRAQRAWRRAKLQRITLHEARHTCASIFIAAGLNAKALSEMMGHSSISVTFDIYGHLMPGSRDEARELVDSYIERALR